MSYKVLFIGDPHFQVNNMIEVDLFLNISAKLVEEQSPDIIVIAGDVLHTHERLHTLALNKAYELINNMRKLAKTYVLVGNHDMCNNQQFLTTNHWMNGMKEWSNVVIVDKVIMEILGNKKMIFVPYVPPGRFIEALDTIGNWNDSDCIFAHQEFYGCKMGAIVSVDGDKWPEDAPEIVSGHIHCNQKPQSNIYYSGSAMQHAFGESEKKIIALLTFTPDKKIYDLEEINLQLPKKKIVYIDVEEIEKYEVKDNQDKIKLTVNGDYEEFKTLKKTKKYKDIIEKGVKVVFKPKKQDIVKKDEKNTNITSNNFNEILNTIITEERNSYLMQSYELVLNGKEINENDILFL